MLSRILDAIAKSFKLPISKLKIDYDAHNDKPIGYALFFHSFSTFLGRAGMYLEDLYITPEYRGRGYGKGLLRTVANIAVERKCGRLEWSCLDWNKPSIDFYLSVGATPMNGWTTYRLSGDSLTHFSAGE